MTEELVKLIAKRFIERRDVKAVQQRSGIYTPDRSKFTIGDIRAHLNGEISLGHYLVSPEGNCRLFAFDIDLIKSYTPPPPDKEGRAQHVNDMWTRKGLVGMSPREVFRSSTHEKLRRQLIRELRGIADGLAARTQRILGIPVAVSYSGNKGLHVYGFTGPLPAPQVRQAALNVIVTTGVFRATRGDNFYRHTNRPEFGFPNVEVEVFPKQDSLSGKDLGNLMRLPLGVNRKTGDKAYFISSSLREDQVLNEMDPVTALTVSDLR